MSSPPMHSQGLEDERKQPPPIFSIHLGGQYQRFRQALKSYLFKGFGSETYYLNSLTKSLEPVYVVDKSKDDDLGIVLIALMDGNLKNVPKDELHTLATSESILQDKWMECFDIDAIFERMTQLTRKMWNECSNSQTLFYTKPGENNCLLYKKLTITHHLKVHSPETVEFMFYKSNGALHKIDDIRLHDPHVTLDFTQSFITPVVAYRLVQPNLPEHNINTKIHKELRDVRAQLESAKDQNGDLKSEVERYKELYEQRDGQVSTLSDKVDSLKRTARELKDQVTELSRYRQDFERLREYQTQEMSRVEEFEKQQEKLRIENSKLRDKICSLRGGSQRLESNFLTVKQMSSMLEELKAQSHSDALEMIRENQPRLQITDAFKILWDVFWAVKERCDSKFSSLREVLCMDVNGNSGLKNEFMAVILEHSEKLLDKNGVKESVCFQFDGVLGSECTQDGKFEKYVADCADLCWAVTLSTAPSAQFWVIDDVVQGDVLEKSQFKSMFDDHIECEKLRNALRIRFLGYVLPGLKVEGLGQEEVKPCVFAERDESPLEMKEEVISARKSEKSIDRGLESAHENDHIPANGGTLDEARTKLAVVKQQVESLFENYEYGEAWDVLIRNGIDLETYSIVLECKSCEANSGILTREGPTIMCNESEHTDISIAALVEA